MDIKTIIKLHTILDDLLLGNNEIAINSLGSLLDEEYVKYDKKANDFKNKQ